MTATHSKNNRTPLKVVPPTNNVETFHSPTNVPTNNPSLVQPVAPTPLEKKSPSVQPEAQASDVPQKLQVKPESETSSSSHRWLLVGAVLIGIGCLGMIPISHRVSGQATLDSTPEARQTVTMPLSGTVKEILVSTNQTVVPGTAIALLESESLNQDISEADIELERSREAVASTQQQLQPLQAQFNEARVKAAAAHRETEYLRQQLNQLNQGSPPPEILRLQSEIAGIKSEIAGLNGELAIATQRRGRYETAFRSGALARNLWEDVQRQQQTLRSQIAQKESQIRAVIAQIEAVQQSLQEKYRLRTAEEDYSVAQMQSMMRQVEAAVQQVQTRSRVAEKLQAERTRQLDRQQERLVRASVAGTVVTPSLDQLHHRYVEAGATLLQIVDLNQLMVNVQIRPEDAPLVKPGAMVTFRPQGTGLLNYTGTVQEVNIAPVVISDGVQQPPAVTVRVLLNQRDELLRPGLQGYAHIETESLRLYQKVVREFVKLVPVGKFF